MTERQLDDEIDRAVSDMMAVDADPAFRSRVLERLDRSKPRRHGMPLLAVTTAAAVVVVVAVMMTRTPGPSPITQQAERTAPAVAPPVADVVPGPGAPNAKPAARPTDVGVGSPRTRSTRRTASVPQIAQGMISAAVAVQEPTVEITPLAAIDPIAVAGLEPSRIATQDIVVAPLEPIAEVQVAPLAPRSERD
jgi:hypothetical protein